LLWLLFSMKRSVLGVHAEMLAWCAIAFNYLCLNVYVCLFLLLACMCVVACVLV
jgi:hypothetical protein